MIPLPRTAIADKGLGRPNWLKSDHRDPNKLWLDKNENTDPAHWARVREILAGIDPSVYATYPDPAATYEKLAASLGVAPDMLLIGDGSDGIIRRLYDAFISPDDTVIATTPSFAMYEVYGRMYGARRVDLAYRPSNAGPALTSEEIIDSIKAERPRLVCIPNPDSPTGTVFSLAEMRAIIEAAGAAGAAMLVDEAYYPFHNETVLPLLAGNPHLVVARSTAKAWGVAGLRFGYAVSSREMIQVLHKVKPRYECSNISMTAFGTLLDHPEVLEQSVARLEDGKKYFLDSMEKMGFRVLRGKGNFAHVAFGAHSAALHPVLGELAYYRPDFNDPCLKGFSRFSSAPKDQFAILVDAVTRTIKGLS